MGSSQRKIMAKLVWRAFTFDEQRAGVEDGLTAVQISVVDNELMIDACWWVCCCWRMSEGRLPGGMCADAGYRPLDSGI